MTHALVAVLLSTVSSVLAAIQPGDVIDTIDLGQIEKGLKELDDIPGLLYTKTLSVAIGSQTGELENPKVKLLDGISWSTLPYSIHPEQTAMLLFSKYYLGVKGVYGVLSYDIKDTPLMVVVMLSLPFNQILGTNMFNFKIVSRSTKVDSDLVKHLYEYGGAWYAGSWQTKTEYGIKIIGTMSDSGFGHLVVGVDPSEYSIVKPPYHYAECSSKLGAIGKRCWKECTPTGWCWTKQHCKKDSDCDGQTLICNDHCNAV